MQHLHSSIVLDAPSHAVGLALESVPGRTPYLRYVRGIGFLGPRLALDVRVGPVRRELTAPVTCRDPGRITWTAVDWRGALCWTALRRGHTVLELELDWTPDTMPGLLAALLRLDRMLIPAELRRLGEHLRGAARGTPTPGMDTVLAASPAPTPRSGTRRTIAAHRI